MFRNHTTKKHHQSILYYIYFISTKRLNFLQPITKKKRKKETLISSIVTYRTSQP